MKTILHLSAFICLLSSFLLAEQWSQNTLGDFYLGTRENVTFSELPGTRHIKDQKASIKIASKGPNFKRTNWDPPPKEVIGGGCKFSDLDNDGDYDLVSLGNVMISVPTSTVFALFISITENIGTRFEPLFRFKGTFSCSVIDGMGTSHHLTTGDIDNDGIQDIIINIGKGETHRFIGFKGKGGFSFERRPEWDIPAPCWQYYIVPALGDFNNDGFADLIGTAPYFATYTDTLTAFLFWENNKGEGFLRRPELDPASKTLEFNKGLLLTVDLADLDMDGDLDLYYCWSEEAAIESIENTGGPSSPAWKEGGGIIGTPTNPTRTLAYHNISFGDMNGDGYEELFVSGPYILCWENTKEYKDGRPIFRAKEDPIFPGYHGETDVCFADLDNNGSYDEILSERACAGAYLVFKRNPCPPDDPYYFETFFGSGIFNFTGASPPFPTTADLDNDGRIDILVSGGDIGFNLGWIGLKNTSTSPETLSLERQPSWTLANADLRERFGIPPYKHMTSVDPFLVDLDNDGDYDLIIGSGGYEATGSNSSTIYGYLFAGKNIGTKENPYFVRETAWEEGIPKTECYHYGPSLCDLDGDSDYDLIITNISGGGGSNIICENIGSISSPIWQRNTAWEDNMNYYAPYTNRSPVDIDNDGDYDLAIMSGGDPHCLKNRGEHFCQATFTSSVMSINALHPYLRVLQKKTVPKDTKLDIFIRTGKTASPDLSWSDWIRIDHNDEIGSSFRYLQYKAILSTSDLEKSPILYEIKFVGVISPLALTVTPAIGAVGDLVTVKGSGFSPDKMVSIDFGSIQTKVDSERYGSFSLIFLITPQLPLTILIKAQDEEENLATQTFTFSHRTIYVDGGYKGIENGSKKNPFSNIQRAINIAVSGYRIEVGSGTYKESICIRKNDIELIGIDLPTIMASSTGGVIYFEKTKGSSISGFRITGAKFSQSPPYSTGFGIKCRDASTLISNNIITGNSEGIGVEMLELSNNKEFIVQKIINNTIVDNSRYGIICYSLAQPIILNNIIAGNGTTSSTYYAIYNNHPTPGGRPGSVTADYNLIYNNGRYGTGTYYNCSGGEKTVFLDPGLTEDYHLTSSSPCIDRGTTTVYLSDKDAEGNRRIANQRPDIGGYEYQGNLSPPNIVITKSSDKRLVGIGIGQTLTYTITYKNQGESMATDVNIIEVLPEKCRLQTQDFRLQTNYWYDGDWQETFSELATKIKWLIPEVNPAGSGTVSFTVRVE